ncbi:signal peptidase II [Streptomyces sp. NPDC002577]
MAEAERIIGTPDTPEAAGAVPSEPSDGDEAAAAPRSSAAGAVPERQGGAEESTVPSAEERPKGKRKMLVLIAVAAFAYVLDLVSKMIVVAKLEHHEPVEIVGDWLRLEAVRNAGAAFGIGEAFTVIFTVIAAAVIIVIARLARKLYSLPWAIALGLLLGGALGNLTDRLFRSPGVFEGAVVDFIAPKGFAVFNLADSAIVCGGILIVLLSFRGLDPDGTVHKD